MLGRYNRHDLTVGEYSDAMEFIRNYWWNYQDSPKYREITNSILNKRDKETCVVKCRQVGMSQYLTMLACWLVIKAEKEPVNIAFIGHHARQCKELKEAFVTLMDSIEPGFCKTHSAGKSVRFNSENSSTVLFANRAEDFCGLPKMNYIFWDEFDFMKLEDMKNIHDVANLGNTKNVFVSTLNNTKDYISVLNLAVNQKDDDVDLIYFNWFDVPSRREGLRLIRPDGRTNESVNLSEDSKYDHELFVGLLKKGWELTSDWRENFKKNGLGESFFDSEVDCISNQERQEINDEQEEIRKAEEGDIYIVDMDGDKDETMCREDDCSGCPLYPCEECKPDVPEEEYETREETEMNFYSNPNAIKEIVDAYMDHPNIQSIKYYDIDGNELDEFNDKVRGVHIHMVKPSSIDKIETSFKIEPDGSTEECEDKKELGPDSQNEAQEECAANCRNCDNGECKTRKCPSLNEYIEKGRELFGEEFALVAGCPYDCRGVEPEARKYNELREIFGKELSDQDIMSKFDSALKTLTKLVDYITLHY